MARALRLNIRGGWYHVTTRGTERKVVYKDDACCWHFLELLQEAVERFAVKIHAYALMANHTHLVVETPEGNLSAAMQWLNGSYSMWFNRRERRVGPLLQGRFKAVMFEGKTEAWAVTRYVHLNPARLKGLGLDKGGTQAEALGIRPVSAELLKKRLEVLKEYRWSSYPYYAGWRSDPEWMTVNEVLAGGQEKQVAGQRAAYRRYVESALGQELIESPLDRAASGFLLGNQEWIERMRRLLTGDRKEQKAFRHLEKRPDWSQVRRAVETVKGERWSEFCDRYGDWGRDLAFYIARRRCGISLRELGEEGKMSNYYAVAQCITRTAHRLPKDKRLKKALKEVLQCINIQT
jgi:REP element-mobilizing transposase RayT